MIVRFLPFFVPDWEAAFAKNLKYSDTKLPHWALSSFAPGEKEGGQISVYELDADVEIADIAAALAFQKNSVARCFFVGASRSSIEASGLLIKETKGLTQHPAVNERHRDIAVPDRTALTALASIFLKGDPLNVEKKEVEVRLAAHARLDAIDWVGTAKSGNQPAWLKVQDFTKRSLVTVCGQPLT